MSYFTRMKKFSTGTTPVGGRLENLAGVMRGWDESLHPRGKTSPQSRGGSFKPGTRSTAPDSLNNEVQRALTETKQVAYAWLAKGRVSDPVTLRTRMQAHFKEWMGPGYEASVDKLAQEVWAAYSKEPSEYHEPREWMMGLGQSTLTRPATRRHFEQLNKDEDIFTPHLFWKREFVEADHPRGKTTPESTPGSFAPSSGRSAADSMNVQELVHGGFPEQEFSSNVGQRSYKEMNTPALDAEVKASATPSQTLKAQFGVFPTEQEILNIVREDVGQEEWNRYLTAAQRMEDTLEKTGIARDHYATARQVTEPDGTVKTVYDYDADRINDVHSVVIGKYLDHYDALAAQQGDQQPELVILGGRGGSGKSAFAPPASGEATDWNFAFFGHDAVVIDPDEVKKDLAAASKATGRYALDQTWNPATDGASYWHEESSDLTKVILHKMRERAASGIKANVVMDLTLASNKLKDVQDWKNLGYFTTVTNINIPVANSAGQALRRYLQGNQGRGGRMVPIHLIANSKDNEKNFDSMINAKDGAGNNWVDHWELFTAGTRRHRSIASGGRPRPGRG